MKFKDGYWMDLPGMKPYRAVKTMRVTRGGNSVSVLASTKEIRTRGDTLDGPVLEYSFSSPKEDILKVTVSHFRGGIERGPFFELPPDKNGFPEFSESEKSLEFKSGGLKLTADRENWATRIFHKDKFLTGSTNRSCCYILHDGKTPYIKEQLTISVGENIYGLGEKFTAFVKNGQSADIWNRDGGTGTEQAYKSIPFYISSRGYGIFVNHPELVSFEIGSEFVSKCQFSVQGEKLEYYIIGGDSLKEVLGNYTFLTGKAPLPPAWSFGLWLTTSFTTEYDEKTVTSFVEGMRERDIPLDVFHFDCFWMQEFNWCDFSWDKRIFPDPEAMLKRLKSKGLKISAWINPYIGQASPLFSEAMGKGYLIKRTDGSVWQWDLWQAGMAIVDFTNPGACKWFKDKLRPIVEMGVDSLKTDFGERIPTDVCYSDNSDPWKMHNYYTYLYNKTVFELLEEIKGKGNAVLFARSATAGCQQFPIHWGGDSTSDYESMAESLRGGLSLGLCGFSFWSHDMGGFESTSTADVYKRWAAFGLLSSHSRLHGSSSYRVPWAYDEEAVDVVRYFAKLKNRMMPYIFSQAVSSAGNGLPLMRAMVLEFPEDLTARTLDRQYMLGDSLLVAPVFSEKGEASYYLPEGTWTHLLSGEEKTGGRYFTEKYDYFSLPLFVRPGSVLAFGNEESGADYDYSEKLEIQIFRAEEGSGKTVIFNKEAKKKVRIDIKNEDSSLQITAETEKAASLVLRNTDSTALRTRAKFEKDGDGIRFSLSPGKNELRIKFLG